MPRAAPPIAWRFGASTTSTCGSRRTGPRPQSRSTATGSGSRQRGSTVTGAATSRFSDVRLAPAHVLHLWPTSAFEPPTGDGYDHVAPVVDADIDPVERDLAAAVAVDSRLDALLGATGRAPAVYVTDPFGYRIELKAGRE